MYWDLLKVDFFLCQKCSNKCLVSFATITISLTYVLRLGVFGVQWSMFVDKGRQGGVILFVESIRFFGWILNQFRRKEICFHFSLLILWYLRKETVALFWGLGVKNLE